MTVNYEQIENYLHGGLSAAEHTAFEAAMSADPALAEAVNLYREVETKLQGSIKAAAGEAALKQQLAALNPQYFGNTTGATAIQAAAQVGMEKAATAPVVAISRRRILYYVASAAAVLLVLLWIRPFGGSSKFDPEAVYAQFGPYEVSSWGNVRGGDNAPTDSLGALKMKVDSLFNLNPPKYAAALPILEKIAALDEKDPIAALAKAACYTETNDSAKAMQTINAVEAQAKGELKDQATFYKAKLYMKYKDVAGCRQALQSITGDNAWAVKAQELLKTLPKP